MVFTRNIKEKVELIKGTHKHDLALHNNYAYHFGKKATFFTLYYCSQRAELNCEASLRVYEDYKGVCLGKHTHLPDKFKIEALKLQVQINFLLYISNLGKVTRRSYKRYYGKTFGYCRPSIKRCKS